jgi:hypothetical protein
MVLAYPDEFMVSVGGGLFPSGGLGDEWRATADGSIIRETNVPKWGVLA